MVKLRLVVLRCEDLERSRRFYEALGLSFVEEQHGAGPRHFAAVIADLVIELYPASATHPVNDIRLGFEVTDVEAGVVEDPDGRKIELRRPG
jgi:lactoylglutathione lyase